MNMLLIEELEWILNNTNNKRFVYVSKTVGNLDSIRDNLLSLVDLSKTTSRLILSSDAGILRLEGVYDGAFVDNDVSFDLAKEIPLKGGGFIQVIDPINGELM